MGLPWDLFTASKLQKSEIMGLINGRVGNKINQLLLSALKSSLKLGLIWLIVNMAMMPRKV